ncbi:hypothetical protein D3C85_1489290 [compost metagenome]
MMPEAAVGEDNAVIIIEDKIRAACQRRILDAKLKTAVGQESCQPSFNRGITRADGTHVFAAGRLIEHIRH